MKYIGGKPTKKKVSPLRVQPETRRKSIILRRKHFRFSRAYI